MATSSRVGSRGASMSLDSVIHHAVSVADSLPLGRLSVIIFLIYLFASAVTFIFYARDKSAAREVRWRTPERTLHLWALLGGWPGALLAQRVLHHKSRKRSFQVIFWASAALNCLVIFSVWRRFA
jgi:uncharacterized membrane protein YsdA (DUF1294 family)